MMRSLNNVKYVAQNVVHAPPYKNVQNVVVILVCLIKIMFNQINV
jgi:hypothetical protein